MPLPASHRFDVVFFDLGNTLIYFNGLLPQVLAEEDRVVAAAIRQAGYAIDEARFSAEFGQRMASYYGERDTEFIEYTSAYVLRETLQEQGFGHISEGDLRQVLEEKYAISERHWHLEEDTYQSLDRLLEQGYRLAMISNAGDAANVHRLLERWNLKAYFEHILISAEVGLRKPHPHIFEMGLALMNTTASRAVMVGDTLGADILGARNACMASVWISRRVQTPGNRDHLDTIQADAVIKTLAELPDVLDGWPAAG
jgi:HAD superfamily hydrolase (TIGR01549 family)